MIKAAGNEKLSLIDSSLLRKFFNHSLRTDNFTGVSART
jgi:hypothetical protein